MKLLFACVLFAVVFVSFSSASCKNRHPKFIQYKWSSRKTVYCKYRGIDFGNGSSFTDLKRCQHCECTENGLMCCGIGFYAGTQLIPNCAVVPDKCETAVLNPQKTALCQPESNRRVVKTEQYDTYYIVSYLVTFVRHTVQKVVQIKNG